MPKIEPTKTILEDLIQRDCNLPVQVTEYMSPLGYLTIRFQWLFEEGGLLYTMELTYDKTMLYSMNLTDFCYYIFEKVRTGILVSADREFDEVTHGN